MPARVAAFSARPELPSDMPEADYQLALWLPDDQATELTVPDER